MIPNPDTDRHDNDLHDLFDAATADLSPLPDLVPEAHRIVRRHRLTTRSLGTALSAALVIGAGTFALDPPQRSGGSGAIDAQVGLSASTLSDFKTRVSALLQGIWPVDGETIRPAKGAPQAFEIAAADGKVYPLTVRTDWTAHEGTGSIQVGHTTAGGGDGRTEAEADIMCYRAHVMVSLFVLDTPATLISDTQLHAMQTQLLAAPGLIELAQTDHQVAQAPNGQPSAVPTATPSPTSTEPSSGAPAPSPSLSQPWTGTPSPSPTASGPTHVPSPSPTSYYQN